MADPPRQCRGLARLLLPAIVVLSGCGLAAVVVSPVERSSASPVAVAAASVPDTPSDDGDPPTPGVERIAPPSSTTVPAPTLPGPIVSVEVRSGLVYGTGATANGSHELVLDLYVPVTDTGAADLEGRAAMILVHGGGFTQGTRTNDGIPQLANALAENGIVTASIDHRLAGHDPLLVTPALAAHLDGLDPAIVDEWLAEREVVGAAIEDVWTAAEWLLAQGVDADRVAYGGSSAGAIASLYAAHLGDDLGIETPAVGAVVALWGGYTLTPGRAVELDAGDAPIWAVHGTADPIVPFSYAATIAERGAQVGVQVDLHARLDAGHGFPAIDLHADRTDADVVLVDDLLAFLAAVS